MSLILEGIDIPKGTDGLSITFHSQDGATETHILDATQAVQLPKDHGRLIDANTKIKAELYDSENGTYIEKEMTIEQWFMFMKNVAPTILEAEERR